MARRTAAVRQLSRRVGQSRAEVHRALRSLCRPGREDRAIADQELGLELRSIAVAVRGVAGKAAATNIGAHASRAPALALCAASHELETMLR
jgi:hypothetical protein